MLTATETYVGPATVVDAEGDFLRVRGPNGVSRARMALAEGRDLSAQLLPRPPTWC